MYCGGNYVSTLPYVCTLGEGRGDGQREGWIEGKREGGHHVILSLLGL